MSRMIDADALIEVVEKSRPLNWTDSESELQEDADYNHFIEMINAQPTAYDVKEVFMNNTTEQDVLKFLRSKCHESGCTDSCMQGDACCSLALAIHSIEKQIPMKPLNKYLLDSIAFCPICKHRVYAEEPYCQNCGQKLDWK